jgi:hypothetical protein
MDMKYTYGPYKGALYFFRPCFIGYLIARGDPSQGNFDHLPLHACLLGQGNVKIA